MTRSTPAAAPRSNWHEALSVEELARTPRRMVRLAGRQIALFLIGDDIFACNNRCPHEGYPLSEGTVDGKCTLTCNWHNWKFDLPSGENLYGGDELRTYPVEVRDGAVWVDLADPPPEARRAAVFANLEKAFRENDYGWIAREIARLRLLDVDAGDILGKVVEWSYERLEYGWTHAYAGMAEWLALFERNEADEEAQLACLLEAVAHTAHDVLREPRYPYDDGGADDSAKFDPVLFAAAIEEENEAAAVGMLRGALAGTPALQAWENGLEGAFARASLAHYLDFGHPLIYTAKIRTLLRRLPESTAAPLLLSLLRDIVFATREDLIPEFAGYGATLAAWGEGGDLPVPGPRALQGLGLDRLFARLRDSAAAPPRELFRALLGLNALNMLGFDLAHQDAVRVPVSKNVTWLDFTHGITFADAVLRVCTRYPALWPQGLLQMACFAGRNAAFARAPVELDRWAVPEPDAFFAAELDAVIDHDCDEFIVAVHRLKTLRAAQSLGEATADEETSALVLAGVNRYLQTPTRLKRVRRTAHQARRFVAMD